MRVLLLKSNDENNALSIREYVMIQEKWLCLEFKRNMKLRKQ